MKYFKPNEFMMGKEPVFDKMDQTFLRRLDFARELAGIPFRITSSFRTPEYNEKVGGSPNSAHTEGKAVDISCLNGQERFKILTACIHAGFTRIGLARTFIHIDSSTKLPSSVVWFY